MKSCEKQFLPDCFVFKVKFSLLLIAGNLNALLGLKAETELFFLESDADSGHCL